MSTTQPIILRVTVTASPLADAELGLQPVEPERRELSYAGPVLMMVCFIVKYILRRRALNRQPGSGGARREQKPTGYFERFLFVSVSVMDSCLGQICSVITVGFLKGATGVKGSGISCFKLCWEGKPCGKHFGQNFTCWEADASRYTGFPFDGNELAKTRFMPRNTVKML